MLLISSTAYASSSVVFTEMTWLLIGIFAAAKILGSLVERFQIPSLVGEILAGAILGNLHLLGLDLHIAKTVLSSNFFQYAAELGMVFLLFQVGLESNIKDLTKVGLDSFVTAVIGVVIPTALGFVAVKSMNLGDNIVGLFVGATFAATSVGITAKFLKEAGKLKAKSAQIILGAAVIDDILGLILLATLGGIVSSGSMSVLSLGVIFLKVVIFFAGAIVFHQYLLPHGFKVYRFMEQPGFLTVLAVLLALFFANLSQLAGLAPIVGAFAAGLLLDDVKLRHSKGLQVQDFEHVIKPITEFLLPLFFVAIGLQLKVDVLANPSQLLLIFLLMTMAILSKSVCGFMVRSKDCDRLGIGFGMIPRGEVGLIFSTFALQHNILNDSMYSILVFVVLLTTLIGPVLLKTRIKNF